MAKIKLLISVIFKMVNKHFLFMILNNSSKKEQIKLKILAKWFKYKSMKITMTKFFIII